ncbi:hypothetical protein MNB_SV-5-1037 [hydrothermal vent metagenome]|uniref:DUF309 domain-containing protein n=1 Tax=hydrothermal vent metagenome TaxID=652676 RepID=A0A1W1EEE0_9ZZZZ
MLKMNNDLEGALKEYISLLNKEEYFEAHEVLEEAWHPLRIENSYLKNLVKGLINGAVSFEHLKRNRSKSKESARKVMVSFDKHKHLYNENIEHAKLFKEACDIIEKLKSLNNKIYY